MLKKVEDIKNTSQLRASAVRGLKTSISSKFIGIEEFLPALFPSEFPVLECKFKAPHNHIVLITVNSIILFIQSSECIIPHLKILHQYPYLLKRMQVDKGAIKHVISGANIMCKGLTSPGGIILDAEEGEVVSITGEGKTHIIAVGIMRKSSQQIKTENNGIGIETLHYLGDGIWRTHIGS
jgi:malignant T-cell-amplified sequence